MIHFHIVLPCILRTPKTSLSFIFAGHIFYRPTFVICPVRAVCIETRTAGITAQQMWLLLKKFNPSSRRRDGPISRHINGLGTNKNMVVGPDGALNQEWLCWRRPAANYCSAQDRCQWFAVSRQPDRTGAIERGSGKENHCRKPLPGKEYVKT
jgi:hypothetical protein